MAMLDRDVPLLWQALWRGSPAAAFEFVDVTFTTANIDHDVLHGLTPPNPEDVEYIVLRADRATSIYHDQTGTRRPWGHGYIILRSSTANAVVKVLLMVKRT